MQLHPRAWRLGWSGRLITPLPDEETAGRYFLVSLALGLVRGELSPKGVADRLSMTVAARTREETRFLSVAAEYSKWISADELPAWENDLSIAARSLATSIDRGPGVPNPRHQ